MIFLGRGSAGGVAAVDRKRDADHEAGYWAAEPEHGRGDLVCAPEPADRLVGQRLGHVEFALGDHLLDHRGLDRSRADRVDADAAGRVSSAALLVRPRTPCLEAWYAARPGSPTRPPSDEQLTMAPLPCARICRSSCFMHAQTPRRLIAFARSKNSVGSWAASVGGAWMPALLNAKSSRPKSATARSTSPATCTSSETSQTTPSPWWPPPVSSAVAVRRVCSLLSASTTTAPDSANACAVASPMPEPAPVTTATRPLKS